MNAMTIVPNHDISAMERIAKALASSRLFGVQNVEQALALCLVAQAEGRHPATAAGDYSIIQGRPSKKADAMLRDFLSSGGKVEWHSYTDDKADATFTHPLGGSIRLDWTMARAKQAQLASAMYTKYPRQMLRARVISEGVRTVFPGATSGMYVPEETADFDPKPVQLTQIADDQELLEGTPQPPKSAHQARKDGDFERLTAGMNACKSEAALTAWATREADAIGALPHGWKRNLRADYSTLLGECRQTGQQSAQDDAGDPSSVFIEHPSPDASVAVWNDYLDDVLRCIGGAMTEAEVHDAMATNSGGIERCALLIPDAESRVAAVGEARIAELVGKAA